MHLRRIVVLCLIFLCGASARAADGFYFGAVGALAGNDLPGFDDAVNAGIRLGHEFAGIGIGDIAIEGSYTTSVSDGDLPGGGNWSVDTFSGFGVFRSAGPIYLKARAGATRWDIGGSGQSRNGTDFSWGLGLGFSFGLGQLEFEYTKIEQDIDFFGIALNIKTPK